MVRLLRDPAGMVKKYTLLVYLIYALRDMLMGINKQKRDWIGVHTWLCVLVPFAVQPWCRDRWAVEEGAALALLRARSGH